MDDEPRITRRRFLKSSATAVAFAGLGSTGAQPVAARTIDDPLDYKPEHVQMYFDEEPFRSRIELYQPRLRTGHLDVEPEAQYAAYFKSAESDLDVIAYWVWYPTQVGLSSLDSHAGDREPILVFLDGDGSIDHISYSAWHYLIARDYAPDVDDETHPWLTVAKPHHHYFRNDAGSETGEYVPLDDFRDIVGPWYANGWSADPSLVLDPWKTEYRESWWAPGAFGVSFLEQQAQLSLFIARVAPWREVTSDF